MKVNSETESSENHNGFEFVKKEGIFLQRNKCNSRRFAKCKYNDFDEMEYHNVRSTGIMTTNNGKLINCHKVEVDGVRESKEKEKVECDVITEGGYYT